MGYDFDKKIQKMKNIIAETNTEVIKCQMQIDKELGQSNGRITHHATTKLFKIMDTAQEYTKSFQENVKMTFTEYTEKYKDRLKNIARTQVNILKDMIVTMEMDLEMSLRGTTKTINMEVPLAEWLGSRIQSSGLWVHIPPSGPVCMYW
jgi:uncharacterized protein YeaO (DUF488 family)